MLKKWWWEPRTFIRLKFFIPKSLSKQSSFHMNCLFLHLTRKLFLVRSFRSGLDPKRNRQIIDCSFLTTLILLIFSTQSAQMETFRQNRPHLLAKKGWELRIHKWAEKKLKFSVVWNLIYLTRSWWQQSGLNKKMVASKLLLNPSGCHFIPWETNLQHLLVIFYKKKRSILLREFSPFFHYQVSFYSFIRFF